MLQNNVAPVEGTELSRQPVRRILREVGRPSPQKRRHGTLGAAAVKGMMAPAAALVRPYEGVARPGGGVPGANPAAAPGTVASLPIGEPPPPVPITDTGQSLQFRVLARWESASPVRLAGGPELPEGTAGSYVIRHRGMPLWRRQEHGRRRRAQSQPRHARGHRARRPHFEGIFSFLRLIQCRPEQSF